MINEAYRRVGPRRLQPMAQPVPLALRERTLLRLRDRASSIETILINGPELLAGLHRRIAELEERSTGSPERLAEWTVSGPIGQSNGASK